MRCRLLSAFIFVALLALTTMSVDNHPALGQTLPETDIFLPLVSSPDPWAEVDPSSAEIVIWHPHTGGRESTFTQIVDTFNATNEWGIVAEAVNKNSYGQIYAEMLNVLNTEAAPDLVFAFQNQISKYQESDALLDMRSLVSSQTWGLSPAEQDDFYAAVLAQDVFPAYGFQRLAFPPSRSMDVLYYNEEWLLELDYESPPTTPAQFQEMACAASATPFSERTGSDSFGYMLSLDASRFASWIFAFGGTLYDDAANEYMLDSQAAVDAMTFLQELFELGCAEMAQARFEDQSRFGNGELLFALASSSGMPFFDSAVTNGADFQWSVNSLAHTTNAPVVNVFGASISMPKQSAQTELASWLFLKYFTSPSVQGDWVSATNYFPVRKSVADNLEDYFAENPAFETAFELLPFGESEPSAGNYEEVRNLIVGAMESIVSGADVQTTLEQLNAAANALD